MFIPPVLNILPATIKEKLIGYSVWSPPAASGTHMNTFATLQNCYYCLGVNESVVDGVLRVFL